MEHPATDEKKPEADEGFIEVPRCRHEFTRQFLQKPVPTFCNFCFHILWLWDGKVRHCGRCGIFLHERCFRQIVENKESFYSRQYPANTRVVSEEGDTIVLAWRKDGEEEIVDKDGVEEEANDHAPPCFVEREPAPTTVTTTKTTTTATATATTRQFVHKHKLAAKTFLRPTFCDVCGLLLLGLVKQGCECSECDFVTHKHCIAKLREINEVDEDAAAVVQAVVERSSVRTEALSEASANATTEGEEEEETDELGKKALTPEEQQALTSISQNDAMQSAMSDSIFMLKKFNDRHKRLKLAILNPLCMHRVHAQHAETYETICAGFPDVSPSVLPSRDLQEIRHVLRYAIAAYGQAYEEGCFASCAAAGWMRIANRHLLHPKAENNNRAVVNILAIPRNSLVHSQWGNTVFDPSYCLVTDREMKIIVLAFRGSLSDADFLTDACGHSRPFGRPSSSPENDGGEEEPPAAADVGLAHDGITQMIDRVFEDKQLFRLIAEERAAFPEHKFVITGHSLGAALATLFAARCVLERTFGDASRSIVRAFAFAPPPVLDSALAGQFDQNITAIVCAKDVVPRLQFNSLDRLGNEVVSSDSAYHSHGHVSLAEVAARTDLGDDMFIAGRVFLLTKPDGKDTRLIEVRRTNVLLQRIFISSHMIENHLPSCYSNGLEQAHVKILKMEEGNNNVTK